MDGQTSLSCAITATIDEMAKTRHLVGFNTFCKIVYLQPLLYLILNIWAAHSGNKYQNIYFKKRRRIASRHIARMPYLL